MMFDRSFTPLGTVRQMAAIFAHGNRVPRLGAVTAPTLVIHGLADPLVPVEGGRDTAKSIPGAQLLEIEGMGHDLPPGCGRASPMRLARTRRRRKRALPETLASAVTSP